MPAVFTNVVPAAYDSGNRATHRRPLVFRDIWRTQRALLHSNQAVFFPSFAANLAVHESTGAVSHSYCPALLLNSGVFNNPNISYNQTFGLAGQVAEPGVALFEEALPRFWGNRPAPALRRSIYPKVQIGGLHVVELIENPEFCGNESTVTNFDRNWLGIDAKNITLK